MTGLLYGDEGKGSITDFLVRESGAKLVVRHNGGAQAAHRVELADGRSHVFAQWGSGTFAGARTFLSRYMIVDPLAAVNEASHLQDNGVLDPWGMLYVDERALVTTPYHKAANRLREAARGDGRHGSCGMGIGEAYEDRDKEHAIRFRDLFRYGPGLLDRLTDLRFEKIRELEGRAGAHAQAWEALKMPVAHVAQRLCDAARRAQLVPWQHERGLMRELADGGDIVFEGAQGVLLDQHRGVQPYTTWSNTTSENARAMLPGMPEFEVVKVGVARAYVTRHGPGPLATYDADLTAALPDKSNVFGEWQREFRCGRFDHELFKHAISIEGGIDELALTCVDRVLGIEVGATIDGVVNRIQSLAGIRPSLVSTGPTAEDKRRC